MKKLSALITAFMLSAMAVMPSTVYADPEEDYLPVMYIAVEENEKITILPDGTVYINTQDLTGDDSIRINIYVHDESKSCWYIAPKLKCADGSITFNEKAVENETLAYSSRHEFISSVNKNYNTLNMTLKTPLLETGTKLEVVSENTDDYPIAYVDADINSEITAGKYRIYFLTETEDDPDQRLTEFAYRYDDGASKTFTPETKEQKIIVSDRMLGDVDGDGQINAIDASFISIEYASLSVIDPVSTLTVGQTNSADVNLDGFVDANDASAVQGYYGYLSAEHDYENELTFAEYLATR